MKQSIYNSLKSFIWGIANDSDDIEDDVEIEESED